MSYAASASLQKAIYDTLSSDPLLVARIGTEIYDTAPGGNVAPIYVTLGAEQVVARPDCSATLTRHRLTISVVSDAAGFLTAKEVAAAVTDALDGAQPVLERGCLVSLRFEQARATRAARNKKRRIDLRFVALVDVPRS